MSQNKKHIEIRNGGLSWGNQKPDSLQRVVAARHKCERPRQIVRYTKVVKLCCLENVS